MTTFAEHKDAAEALMARASGPSVEMSTLYLAEAQVHATLAAAEATMQLARVSGARR